MGGEVEALIVGHWTLGTEILIGCSPRLDYEASGIISNAIANAEKSPALGQENTASLLQQQSKTTKPALAASQFTFSCESQVPGSIQWPGMLICLTFKADPNTESRACAVR